MQPSEDKKRRHVEISVCPTKISIKTERKYKERKMKDILSSICALQNGDGGVLALHYEKTPPKHHIVDCVRMIEQRVKEITSCTTVANLTLDVGPQRLFINVQKSNHPITISYNLHLPSESQVMTLSPSEPIGNIKQILHKHHNGNNGAMERQSHIHHFVKGQDSKLRESKCVTLKNLKVSPSKCITLADRMTGKSNKFASYVSAFANHSGGRIYYGINDNGIVEGKEITEKDKNEVIKKVTNTINKMIWPLSVKPRRGNQWDICFESVADPSGGEIPSTFVIVVSVAPCPGGVFSEAPESYHLVEGRAEKMSFHDWLSHFTERRATPAPRNAPLPITWSSDENKKVYHELTTRLGKLRSDNKMVEFENLSDFAKVMFPKSNAALIVISEKIVAACQKLQIEKAEKFLNDYNKLLESTEQDRRIFEVKEQYSKSRIERAKGNNKESLEIVKGSLETIETNLHAEVITVFSVLFYIHAAAMSMGISRKKSDDPQLFLQSAERNMKSCVQEFQEETVLDLQQELHILLAINRLEIPRDAKNGQEMHKNIAAAESELDNVHGELTLYRRIENLLAHCQLHYRRSDIAPDQVTRIEYLKKAYGYGTNARNLATRNNFEEIFHYANKCLADVTERIVRNWHRCKDFEKC